MVSHPSTERRSRRDPQRAVDHFDLHDELIAGHVGGKHDREVCQAFQCGGSEADAGSRQIAVAGHCAQRKVLVNQQSVEHLADTAQRPQLRMAEVSVFAQHRRITLHSLALRADRAASRRSEPAAARC